MNTSREAADPRALLRRAEELIKVRRRAVVEDLEVCLAWADVHGEPPVAAVDGGERLVALGGDGTPWVRELCLGELSIARGVHVMATRAAVADALDLRHRLPWLWRRVQDLEIEPWVARKVAVRTRGLSIADVQAVDRAVAAAVAQSAARVLELAEAKTIEADQAAHRAAIARSRARKGVWLSSGREDPVGLRSIYARVETADAVWVDATLQRVAGVLAGDKELRVRHHPELADRPTNDALRAAAFGWLARPGDLAALLEAPDPTPETPETPETPDAPRTPTPRARRGPGADLYVHLHQAALEDQAGVARVEGIGPLLLEQVVRLLGHANVRVKPVIDLAEGVSTSAYEFPDSVRERARLRVLGDVFPHATGTARRLDGDHATPYDAAGPPGQTSDHNIAPLGRRHHRMKTHLAYRLEQVGPTTYRWTTPHGLIRWVDAFGTHQAAPAV